MSEQRAFRGIWIPAELWLSKGLTVQEKIMLAEIDSLQHETRGCFKSNKRLADFFQLSASRVSEIISSLEKKHYIRVEMIRQDRQIIERRIFINREMVFTKPPPESRIGGRRNPEEGYSGNTENPIRNPEEGYSGNAEESNTILSNTIENTPKSNTGRAGAPVVQDDKKVNKKKTRTPTGKYSLAGMDLSSWPAEPSPQVLADWLTVRRERKAPITQTAITRLGNQLTLASESGHSVDQCLSLATERGWRGFEAAWIIRGNGGPPARPGYFSNQDHSKKDYHEGVDKDGRF